MFSSLCCLKQTKTGAVNYQEKGTEHEKHQAGAAVADDKKLQDERSRAYYYDFLAPSVYHLQTTFLETIKASGLDETATIYDIESLKAEEMGIIRQKGADVKCPIDGRTGASYVHSLEAEVPTDENNERGPSDQVGTATHMLSYAWGYTIGDIVDTLVEFCKSNNRSTKTTYIWICALCNNQHRIMEKNVPFDEFKYVFNKRVKGIGNVLAMMTPWDDPGYLKRVWCIFEMYSADVNEDTNIQIIMPPSQKNSLMTAVMKPTDTNGRSGLDELFQTLSNTKIENASASKIEDKINILKIVEEGPGCANFNNVINHLLRQWIRDTVFESANTTEAEIDIGTYSRKEVATYLTFCASFFSRIGEHRAAKDLHQKGLEIYKSLSELGEDPEEIDELTARCYNNIGTEFESLAEYDEALENHHKCREIFEKIYGKVHENTSVSYFNIGAVLRKLERNEEALEMYEKSLEIDTKIKGENHIDVALSYSYIGRIKQNNEDYDGALELFEKSMKIRVDTYGKDHPDAAIGYGDLGLLNHMLGKYDEAISMHLAAMEIQEKVLGNLHPDTASVYQNIGGAYYEKKSYDKALEYHVKAKGAYETTFGYDHPKSVTARQWIDIVQDAIEEEKN